MIAPLCLRKPEIAVLFEERRTLDLSFVILFRAFLIEHVSLGVYRPSNLVVLGLDLESRLVDLARVWLLR